MSTKQSSWTIVEVKWIDSASTPGWASLDDIEEQLDQHAFAECVTVGFIVKETDEYVALVMSLNLQNEVNTKTQGENLFIIPKSCIKTITNLRKRG